MSEQGTSSVVDAPEGQEDAVPDAAPAPSPAPEIAQLRRPGRARRIRHRITAFTALLACVAAVLVILAEGRSGDVVAAAPGIKDAARPAWSATGELSDALDALKPGGSPGPSIRAARAAAKAVASAQKKLDTTNLEASQNDALAAVGSALRAQGAWIDAVGSTLANPRSPRRKALAGLAESAAARSKAAERYDVADGPVVRGTGHLLSATKAP